MTSNQSSQWQGISQDITHQQETQTLISELLEKYEITGLVNAAGVLIMRSMLEAKMEDWETLFAVNVMAPIAISQQVAKHFCAKGGVALSLLVQIVRVCHVCNLVCTPPLRLH